MHIGVARLMLHLPEANSLKSKRGIARSLISRIHNQFKVAVAEGEDNDLWQRLTLVVCCVSNDAGHANQVLSAVVGFVEDSRRDLELLDYDTEIISGV